MRLTNTRACGVPRRLGDWRYLPDDPLVLLTVFTNKSGSPNGRPGVAARPSFRGTSFLRCCDMIDLLFTESLSTLSPLCPLFFGYEYCTESSLPSSGYRPSASTTEASE